MTILPGVLILLPLATQVPAGANGQAAYDRLPVAQAPVAAAPNGRTAVRRRSIIPAAGVSLGILTKVFRYNRAEGASLGAEYATRQGRSGLQGIAGLRYAFTDERLQAEAALRHTGAGHQTEARVFRAMRDADPLAPGLTPGNTWSALLLTHDEGAYVFAEGGELTRRQGWRNAAHATLGLRVARESAPRITARSGVNDVLGGDGRFPINEPVTPGTFVTLSLELTGGTQESLEWRAGTELTAGEASHARGWVKGTARREIGAGLDLTASGWLGIGGGTVPQRFFRLGGTESLRGYDAGSVRGPSGWSAGLDLGAAHRIISPIIFVDAGQASVTDLSFSGHPSSSAGVGVSFMRGILRLHVGTPLDRRTDWRFDLIFAARR